MQLHFNSSFALRHLKSLTLFENKHRAIVKAPQDRDCANIAPRCFSPSAAPSRCLVKPGWCLTLFADAYMVALQKRL